jgi:hypothetical protein
MTDYGQKQANNATILKARYLNIVGFLFTHHVSSLL